MTAADITSALDAADVPAEAFDNVVRLLTDEGVEIVNTAPDEVADTPRAVSPDAGQRTGTGDLVAASTCARSAGSRC